MFQTTEVSRFPPIVTRSGTKYANNKNTYVHNVSQHNKYRLVKNLPHKSNHSLIKQVNAWKTKTKKKKKKKKHNHPTAKTSEPPTPTPTNRFANHRYTSSTPHQKRPIGTKEGFWKSILRHPAQSLDQPSSPGKLERGAGAKPKKRGRGRASAQTTEKRVPLIQP